MAVASGDFVKFLDGTTETAAEAALNEMHQTGGRILGPAYGWG